MAHITLQYLLGESHLVSSLVYENLRSIQSPTERIGIACVYCDNQQQHIQTPENLLASVWANMRPNDNEVPPLYMEKLYRVHTQNRTRPDLEQIQFALRSAVDELNKAYIQFDGVDEIGDASLQEIFVEVVKELLLVCNTGQAKLHVLVTSRQRNRFLDGPSVSVEASGEEIASMIEQRIKLPRSFRSSLRDSIARSAELQSSIRDMIVSKANGMFLIADMYIASLLNVTNIRDLREALGRLPDQLDEYYEPAWTRIISQEYRLEDIAHRTISWLLLSRRQLHVDELRHALAVREGDRIFDADSLIAIEEVLEVCQGLVILEEHSQHVKLMHSTTRELFQKQSTDYSRILMPMWPTHV